MTPGFWKGAGPPAEEPNQALGTSGCREAPTRLASRPAPQRGHEKSARKPRQAVLQDPQPPGSPTQGTRGRPEGPE